MFPKYTKYLIVNVVFFTLVFGVGISDCTICSNHHHCIHFPFRCHFREVTFTARLEFRKYKYSRPLTSIDYLKQIHIPFTAVSRSHFYGKPIYCLFKKADKGGFQKTNEVFFNIKAERISFIHTRGNPK